MIDAVSAVIMAASVDLVVCVAVAVAADIANASFFVCIIIYFFWTSLLQWHYQQPRESTTAFGL